MWLFVVLSQSTGRSFSVADTFAQLRRRDKHPHFWNVVRSYLGALWDAPTPADQSTCHPQEEWSDAEHGGELARNPSFVTVYLQKKIKPTQRHFYFSAIWFCFGTSGTQGFIIRDWALWCNFRGIKHLLIKSISTSLAQQCPTCRHCLEMWVANIPFALLHFLLAAACRRDPAALTF